MNKHELIKSERCLYCGSMYNSDKLDLSDMSDMGHKENRGVMDCLARCPPQEDYGVGDDEVDRHGITYEDRWIAAPAVPWSRA